MGFGRMLILIGVVLVVVGVLVSFTPLRLGRLPGDLVFRGKNTVIYLPLMTGLLLSLVLTLILWLFRR